MPDVLVRNVSERTLKALKKRAKERGRSLQEDLRIVLDEVAATSAVDTLAEARRISERLRRRGVHFRDSGEMVAEDRAR